MKKKLIFLILLGVLQLALYTFLVGCAYTSPKDKDSSTAGPKPLEPQVSLQFSDIPLPSGFKFLGKDSYSFQSGDVRVAVLKYTGRPNAGRVYNFFIEQMPMYNWNFINAVEYGRRLLNFDRENETCIITIEPKKLSTEITITIGPKQPASISKGKRISEKMEKPVK